MAIVPKPAHIYFNFRVQRYTCWGVHSYTLQTMKTVIIVFRIYLVILDNVNWYVHNQMHNCDIKFVPQLEKCPCENSNKPRIVW